MREPVPAPTAYSILCNVEQGLQGYLDLASTGDEYARIPVCHIERWLALVHSAVLLLDPPLAAARGLVLWLLALGIFALGWLGCWALQ